jgi:hypothetical protein
LPCYDTISSRMYSRQSSSTLLKWWWDHPMARTISVRWILPQFLLQILSLNLTWIFLQREQNRTSIEYESSVHALLSPWMKSLLWFSHWAPPASQYSLTKLGVPA